eukprot:CAMPEP_0181187058 /NCGR_PEP_ID=MMETSP1096-20121128/10363_1 /TAXON_ID=156174 ORGANISM="Chrysochromulina ericina, Strain CCMP281" /NCGR_SAMPLE_ID=MMETSP1096 /ASSEMBLY_ACC=CAM_ASM_000453 /LENGTH=39 /DNA_ID= /DNA_START= /DNA_END= /DNA_ORIENTATION=
MGGSYLSSYLRAVQTNTPSEARAAHIMADASHRDEGMLP